jgi:hypothetical protein
MQQTRPCPALQSVVLPARGLTGQSMGRNQEEQPTLGKEGIGPKLMIPASPSAFPAPARAEDTAQPHAHLAS